MNQAQMQDIGFIGLGVMGAAMAGHLLAAGHRVRIFTRSRAKATELETAGALWCATPAELAAASEVICSMVGFPADVEAVWLGSDGILSRARGGSLGIDFTTSSPSLAERIAAAGAERGVAIIDAPVSGGDVGAREARLSIMVGGDTEAVTRARPILEQLGKTILHQGGPGAGQHTKMANQIAIAANMIGVCEAIQYARAAGLDAQTVLQSISGGAAGSWSLSNLAPRMLAGDFRPGFYVKHFRKDLGIALAEAQRLQLRVPGIELATRLYRELAEDFDGGDQGTQALLRWYLEGPTAS